MWLPRGRRVAVAVRPGPGPPGVHRSGHCNAPGARRPGRGGRARGPGTGAGHGKGLCRPRQRPGLVSSGREHASGVPWGYGRQLQSAGP